MPYVNITLDVGAAMNAYLVTWNTPDRFSNVIIHLASLHFLKEKFSGKLCLNLIAERSFQPSVSCVFCKYSHCKQEVLVV